MTRQTQQRIRALCLEGLRVMRFINDQQRSRWGKTPAGNLAQLTNSIERSRAEASRDQWGVSRQAR